MMPNRRSIKSQAWLFMLTLFSFLLPFSTPLHFGEKASTFSCCEAATIHFSPHFYEIYEVLCHVGFIKVLGIHSLWHNSIWQCAIPNFRRITSFGKCCVIQNFKEFVLCYLFHAHFLRKSTSCDSILFWISLLLSMRKIYPLVSLKYWKNMHFLALGSDLLWGKN